MNRSEYDNGNLIAFPSREIPENPVTLESKDLHAHNCQHERITIHELERTLMCTDCGSVLDPFDYLRGHAVALRRGWERYQSVVAREREIRENLVRLEKEQKRLKAQVSRLRINAAPSMLDMKTSL